jgi:hypothetical protein
MVDVLKSEGMAEGRKMPLRIPIGADAVEIIEKKCESMIRDVEAWKPLSASTDFGGP